MNRILLVIVTLVAITSAMLFGTSCGNSEEPIPSIIRSVGVESSIQAIVVGTTYLPEEQITTVYLQHHTSDFTGNFDIDGFATLMTGATYEFTFYDDGWHISRLLEKP